MSDSDAGFAGDDAPGAVGRHRPRQRAMQRYGFVHRLTMSDRKSRSYRSQVIFIHHPFAGLLFLLFLNFC